MIRVVAYSLLTAAAALGLFSAYRSSEAASRLALALLLACVAGIVWTLGMPSIAVFVAATLPFATAGRSHSPDTSGARDTNARAVRLRSHLLPIFVAACLGLAAPTLLDAAIDVRNMAAPVEGASAARGGYGLWFALFERGLLLAACVVALLLLALLARAAARRASHGNRGTR